MRPEDRIGRKEIISSSFGEHINVHVARQSCNITLSQVCDEIRLSVEFVTVGFLRMCRHSCCD